MSLQTVISIIFHSIPMVTALTGWMLLLVSHQENIAPVKGNLRRAAVLFYGMTVIATFGIMIHPYSPEVFAFLSAFNYGALLAVPVSLYHLIFILTATGKPESFSKFHYAVPLIVFLTLLVWASYVPYDIRLEVAKDRTGATPGYEAFSILSRSRMEVRMFLSVIYLALILIRIDKYRKSTADDPLRSEKLNWSRALIWLSAVTLLIAVIGSVKSSNVYNSVLAVAATLLLAAFHIEFLYRLIGGRFPVPIPAMQKYAVGEQIEDDPKSESDNTESKSAIKSKKLDKRSFEAWIRRAKPFLDPTFGIEDAVEALGVNRTYISRFVNETYGENFSQFINKLRLKELQRLLNLPSNKKKTAVDLATKAGFGSYRNYLRAKNEEQPTSKSKTQIINKIQPSGKNTKE